MGIKLRAGLFPDKPAPRAQIDLIVETEEKGFGELEEARRSDVGWVEGQQSERIQRGFDDTSGGLVDGNGDAAGFRAGMGSRFGGLFWAGSGSGRWSGLCGDSEERVGSGQIQGSSIASSTEA